MKTAPPPLGRLKAIAAMSENRVIGRENRIPWRLPEDFRWFKEKTMGSTLVMGRKTFLSIGRPLPGRKTVVVTQGSFTAPGVQILHDLNGLNQWPGTGDIFICGGAEIYSQTLSWCSELFLTRVLRVVEGDTFFPKFEHCFQLAGLLHQTPEFQIEHWVQQPPSAATAQK